jgi:hypothetical protein
MIKVFGQILYLSPVPDLHMVEGGEGLGCEDKCVGVGAEALRRTVHRRRLRPSRHLPGRSFNWRMH